MIKLRMPTLPTVRLGGKPAPDEAAVQPQVPKLQLRIPAGIRRIISTPSAEPPQVVWDDSDVQARAQWLASPEGLRWTEEQQALLLQPEALPEPALPDGSVVIVKPRAVGRTMLEELERDPAVGQQKKMCPLPVKVPTVAEVVGEAKNVAPSTTGAMYLPKTLIKEMKQRLRAGEPLFSELERDPAVRETFQAVQDSPLFTPEEAARRLRAADEDCPLSLRDEIRTVRREWRFIHYRLPYVWPAGHEVLVQGSSDRPGLRYVQFSKGTRLLIAVKELEEWTITKNKK